MLVGPLKGNYQIDEALTELLRSTELTFEWTAAKTVSIVRRPPPPPKPPPPPPDKQPRTGLRDERHVPEQESTDDEILDGSSRSWRSRFQLAPGPVEPPASCSTASRSSARALTTVMDLLRLIPQQPFLRPDGFRSNGAQYAELRGLGPDTTLVLINGRRAFASAASFHVNAFDLNQLPLSAVERVEVQLDSISVQARRRCDRRHRQHRPARRHSTIRASKFVTALQLAAASSDQASISAGYRGDNVDAAVIVDYRDVGPLFGAERDLWRNQDYRRFGSPDLRSTLSSPGNVFALPGRLLSIGAPFAAIPEHTAGPITAPDEFRPFELNRESLLQYVPIVTEDRRASAVASVQVNVNADSVAAADLMVVDRRVRVRRRCRR